MKHIIVTIVFTIAVNTLLAQTYNMKIKQGTGTTYSVTSTVDEITFINTTTTPFVCGDVILYGGETYPTILIGSQCWFQKNLNIGTRIAGSSNQTNNTTIEKYCYSDNNTNCVTHGGLYQWNEAMQYVTTAGAQGICPPGWHIPTLAEFTTLQTTVGGSTQGNTLKAIGQGTTIGAGTNTSGFSALLAGYRDLPGTFFYITFGGYFWSSTENNPTPTLALNGNLLYSNSNFVFTYSAKEYGFNVRCLKD